MKKPLISAGLLLLGLAGYAIAGRVNVVWHVNPRTGVGEFSLMSGGACRHHLSAHDGDYLNLTGGRSSDPADCN